MAHLAKYFNISKGSSAEVLTQAIISFEIGYLGKADFDFIDQECRSISRMLNKLMQSRSNTLGEPLPDYPDLTPEP